MGKSPIGKRNREFLGSCGGLEGDYILFIKSADSSTKARRKKVGIKKGGKRKNKECPKKKK